jgi:hypothetical protein
MPSACDCLVGQHSPHLGYRDTASQGGSQLLIYQAGRPDLAGGHLLCFNDDGEGFSSTDAVAMVCLDRAAQPGAPPTPLVAYGDRLVTAAFRLCSDTLVLVKARLDVD